MKQLAVDLVILNERHASYAQDLQASLEALVRASPSPAHAKGAGTRGAIFVLRSDLVPAEARAVLRSAARAVLLSRRGSLAEQVKRPEEFPPEREPFFRRAPPRGKPAAPPPRPALEFFNGLGGFDAEGKEYVTILGEGQWTPAPWINVIANPSFGFQVSAEGGGYTWSGNSRENQLTPWSNDPGQRPAGRGVLRPRRGRGSALGPDRRCRSAKRPGSTSRGTARATAASSTRRTASRSSCCSTSRRTTRSRSPGSRSRIEPGAPRRLSVTAYVEWVLAAARDAAAPFIVTEIDPETGAMLARNPWSLEFGERVAFADLAGQQVAWTGDRTEFLGRNGTLDHPAALTGDAALSNRVGGGLDPVQRPAGAARAESRASAPRSSASSARRPARRRRAR